MIVDCKPKYYPDLRGFEDLAKKGNIVPVYRQLLADTLTPVSAFQKIADSDYAFLLESAAGGEKIASRTYLGCDPFMGIRAYGRNTEIITKGKVETLESNDPLSVLEAKMKEFSWAPVDELKHFSGGAVGYIGYDAVRYFEHLPNPAPDDRNLPDLYFMLYDTVIIFDHINKIIKVVAAARIENGQNEKAYNDAVCRINNMVEKLQKPINAINDDISLYGEAGIKFSSNFEKADFLRSVDKCKEYIKSGDILQVVLSQRLKTKVNAAPFNIYRALRVINPSPYMFYLKHKDLIMVGSSPEVMVKVEDGKVAVRPIAGTRKRGSTDAEDAALAEELLNDPKERAEHIMLLDLGRNDSGSVSKPGTVKVTKLMYVERYSHVMHLVSHVEGKLRPELSCFDALRSCFPAGTVSGAPKIRAMEIIAELEPDKRGPYAGAVGYFSFSGNMDTAITIRTLVVKNGFAYVQAGGGIVYDSVPVREYQESMQKASALLRAVEQAEASPRGITNQPAKGAVRKPSRAKPRSRAR